jgi:hypothetical protein
MIIHDKQKQTINKHHTTNTEDSERKPTHKRWKQTKTWKYGKC